MGSTKPQAIVTPAIVMFYVSGSNRDARSSLVALSELKPKKARRDALSWLTHRSYRSASGRRLDAESEREALNSSSSNANTVRQMPNDLLARYKRAVTDLRGSLNRDPGRSREILRELLGEIRLQSVGDEIYAEFETRPERIFLSARVASNCGCGDRQPDLEAPAHQVVASPVACNARQAVF